MHPGLTAAVVVVAFEVRQQAARMLHPQDVISIQVTNVTFS